MKILTKIFFCFFPWNQFHTKFSKLIHRRENINKIFFFFSLAVDVSGDLVAAGASDIYDVFLWSVQTGHLLEVISGHEGPVSSLSFNPSPASGASQLATVSWDKTLKIWDALNVSSSNTETIEILSDATGIKALIRYYWFSRAIGSSITPNIYILVFFPFSLDFQAGWYSSGDCYN